MRRKGSILGVSDEVVTEVREIDFAGTSYPSHNDNISDNVSNIEPLFGVKLPSLSAEYNSFCKIM
jgi:hypothetical protein